MALRMIYDDIAEGDDTTPHRHMFGSFLGLSVFFTLLVRLTHKGLFDNALPRVNTIRY